MASPANAMDRELEIISVPPADQAGTDQHESSVEPENIGELAGKARSHLRIFAILAALFVSQSDSSASLDSFSHFKCPAFALHRRPGLYNRCNCNSNNCRSTTFSIRIHLDWSCIPTWQCNFWTNMDQVFRHMGPQTCLAFRGRYFLLQLNLLRYVCQYEDAHRWPHASRHSRGWIDFAGQHNCERFVQYEVWMKLG